MSVLPAGYSFPVEPRESLLRAAQRAGLYWPTICQGRARCARCHVVVESGLENVNTMGDEERATLHAIRGPSAPSQERLACRTEVVGPVVFRRRGVRERSNFEEVASEHDR